MLESGVIKLASNPSVITDGRHRTRREIDDDREKQMMGGGGDPQRERDRRGQRMENRRDDKRDRERTDRDRFRDDVDRGRNVCAFFIHIYFFARLNLNTFLKLLNKLSL